jgi:hypothetical protein
MKKTLVLLLGLCAITIWLGVRASSTEVNPVVAAYVPGEMIMCFQPGVTVPAEGLFKTNNKVQANRVMDELVRATGAVHVEYVIPALPQSSNPDAMLRQLKAKSAPTTLEEVSAIFSKHGLDRTVVVRLDRNVDVPRLAADLMRRYPDVIEFAEPNYLHRLDRVPNDSRYRQQWHLPKVGAPAAWDVTTGSSTVVVGVIDSGMNRHADLDAKRFINPGEIAGNGIDDDGNRFVDDVSGWDFVNGDNEPDDEAGHGTYTAGLAASATNNVLDIAGMGWDSLLLPLKAGGEDGTLSTSAIVRATTYAITLAPRGVRVLNMSFGGGGRGQINSIRAANDAGIVVVASSGNGGDDFVGDNVDAGGHFPSGHEVETDNVIGVAATTRNDALATFSNYGLSVGVAAPGVGILSTAARGGTETADGTSASAPIVAGIAALIYARFPDITPLEVRARIEGNVDRVPSLNDNILSGGRVNASKVFESDDVPPGPITDLREGAPPLSFTWTATGDDGGQGAAALYDIRYLSQQITPSNLRFSRKLLTSLKPAVAGTEQTLSLPGNLNPGTWYVLIRVMDNAGNLVESNQVGLVKN